MDKSLEETKKLIEICLKEAMAQYRKRIEKEFKNDLVKSRMLLEFGKSYRSGFMTAVKLLEADLKIKEAKKEREP
jgi:hypothetical protein